MFIFFSISISLKIKSYLFAIAIPNPYLSINFSASLVTSYFFSNGLYVSDIAPI